MNIEEHIKNLKKYIEEDFAFREPIKNMSDFDKYCWNHCKDIENLLTAYEKEKEKNCNAKWYIHQEIVRIGEDIEDYIDDDKEKNKDIIGEFKENLEQWKDVEKLLDGKSKDDLYIDWREYGEYE